jgi:hypothetical protein
MRFFVLVYFSFLQVIAYCQIWPKVYYINSANNPFSVIQSYDKGYIIGGKLYDFSGNKKGGFLFKTTINGDLLWHKTFNNNDEATSPYDLNQTTDGGLIISGATRKTDSWGDPFIMKLNVCGESEWCRIYSIGQGRFDNAISIKQVDGGYIAYIFYGYDLNSNKKIHLYRLDPNGNLIWQQVYGQEDTLMMNGADGYDMTVTPDNHYIISGYCYYPDSGSTSPRYLRPLMIKVDSSANSEWELPWSYINGKHFYGMGNRSIIDNQKIIYTSGRHIIATDTLTGDMPTIMKTDSSGNEILYNDLVPDSWQAVFFNINWFQDSTIALDGGWIMTPGGEGQIGVFKVDQNGTFIDSVNLQKTVYCFSDAIVDKDNKLFLVQPKYEGGHWRTYAWKLNSDLEFDTLYSQPLVYDSLCPHPIASDTIPLDCVIVGLDEPLQNTETGKLKVYPNPAQDELHIVVPDKLKRQDNTLVFNLTTVYHQWRSATIEIYDLFGHRMLSRDVRQGEEEFETDVSSWQPGMYVVRLVYNGQTVASEKVVVE